MRRGSVILIDFRKEGRNAERTARNFRLHKDVHVPSIVWDKTSRKVLTMEFIHGVRLDDEIALKKIGVTQKKVCDKLRPSRPSW